MIEVRVKKKGVICFKSQFTTKSEADVWITEQVVLKSFGKPERWVEDYDCESQGEVISEALAEQLIGGPDSERRRYKFAAQYELEQEDITEKIERAEINSRCLKYLAQTDWYVIRKLETNVEIPEEILSLRAAARAGVVK